MEKLVVRILFGSHLYGTNTPQSDIDYKSVHIPSANEILLQRVQNSTGHKVKRVDGDKNSPEDVDDESYSLQRYLQLLSEGQTVSIDMLFAPKPIMASDIWWNILFHKEKFLTKRSAAFVGYCRTQANKYGIKGSRVAAAKEAMELFKARFDSLGQGARVSDIANELLPLVGEHTQVIQLPLGPQGSELGWFFECCNRKVAFNNTIKAAYEIFVKIFDNYGKRARMAQDNQGVDWKALSHAVRVAEEAQELLATHRITFPLANAAHIMAIKTGQIPYEQVAEEIESLLGEVEKASEASTLPDHADTAFIDELVSEAYRESVIVG